MKLSNKILIGFFGFIFLYLTAIFAEVRLRGIPYTIDDSNSIAETAALKDFSYLVLPSLNQKMYVLGSDNPHVEVRSISGDLLQKISYHVEGDTLILSEPDLEENERVKITVHVPKNRFKGMATNGGRIEISALEQEVLSVTQNSGWINMDSSNSISQLNIRAANESTFNISDMMLNQLKVEIDDSRVTSNSAVGMLDGSIMNDSYVYLGVTGEIRLTKDESSRLDID